MVEMRLSGEDCLCCADIKNTTPELPCGGFGVCEFMSWRFIRLQA